MTSRKALDGTPCAGNLHARSDEGEVASATPRCSSPLHTAAALNRCKGSVASLLSIAAAFAIHVSSAAPSVGSVTYSQDTATKLVTVTYVLSGEPGIPLLDICTNGV